MSGEKGGVEADAGRGEFCEVGFEIDGAAAVGIAERERDALADGALRGAIVEQGLEVRVEIDEAGADDEAGGVDDSLGRAGKIGTDGSDAVAGDGDVGGDERSVGGGAGEDAAVFDQEIGFGAGESGGGQEEGECAGDKAKEGETERKEDGETERTGEGETVREGGRTHGGGGGSRPTRSLNRAEGQLGAWRARGFRCRRSNRRQRRTALRAGGTPALPG